MRSMTCGWPRTSAFIAAWRARMVARADMRAKPLELPIFPGWNADWKAAGKRHHDLTVASGFAGPAARARRPAPCYCVAGVKLPGVWRTGNSSNVPMNSATTPCSGSKANIRRTSQSS